MQYGDRHNHCHSAPLPMQGSTVITVPIGVQKQDCCDDLKAEIKSLKDDLNRMMMQLKAMPDLNGLGAGILSSNGATPAQIKPLSLAELALQLAALMPEHEHDTYQFFNAFGKEIIPRVLPRRP